MATLNVNKAVFVKSAAAPAQSVKKKNSADSAWDDLADALQSLNQYAKTLRPSSSDEIRKLTRRVLKLIR